MPRAGIWALLIDNVTLNPYGNVLDYSCTGAISGLIGDVA